MKLVSVIIPTCNRYDVVLDNANKIKQQDYPNIEIIICDDSMPQYRDTNNENLNIIKSHFRYYYTARFDEHGNKLYGIAGARNQGIVEAQGEYIVFFDDRIYPLNLNCISIFVEKLDSSKDKIWYFGNKGKEKISFVENFSAIRRNQIIDAGMFCERIDKYGAMTRELIARYIHQGFTFQFVEEAKASFSVESTDRERKSQEIKIMREFLQKLGYAKK